MKIINITLPLLLALFFGGCTGVQNYGYQKKEFVRPAKPKAAVERAWLARNKYDHERRMLIPMVGGTRWGAVQEYKEDGTLEYKEWWVRDIKKEDLEASPSTAIRIIKEQNNDEIYFFGVFGVRISSFQVSPCFLVDFPSGNFRSRCGNLLGTISTEFPLKSGLLVSSYGKKA